MGNDPKDIKSKIFLFNYMKKEEMRKVVNEELAHISKEGVDQNILRMFYNCLLYTSDAADE